MQVFITDAERSSFSSINLHSHQGADIKGFKEGYSRKYFVQVVVKDMDNPRERKSCNEDRSYSYSECVDDSIHQIVLKVGNKNH